LAFRILEDIQSLRLADLELAWQEFAAEVAQLIYETAAESYAGRGHKVSYISDHYVDTIDWSDVFDPDAEFQWRFYPASIWPETAAGKMDTAEKLFALGAATPEEIKVQLNGPHLDYLRSLQDEPLSSIYTALDNMLFEGEYDPPTRYDDLQSAVRIANLAYHKAKVDGCPEDRLEMVLLYMDEASNIMKKEAENAAPPAQPQPAVQGEPGAPEIPGQVTGDQLVAPPPVPLPANRQ
jgi:hypothetical protein